MFNLSKFISDSVAFRPVSMFAADIDANKDALTCEIKGYQCGSIIERVIADGLVSASRFGC